MTLSCWKSFSLFAIAATTISCGMVREMEIREKGYSSEFNRTQNSFVITLTHERVKAMGGPHSRATEALLGEIARHEGYCNSRGYKIVYRGPYSDRWDFVGDCLQDK